jgi:predicted TIM-barrel fold metal-dependent hydrolase
VKKSYPVRVKKVRKDHPSLPTVTVRRVRIVLELHSEEWNLLRAYWREYSIGPEVSCVIDHSGVFVAGLKRQLGIALARSAMVTLDDFAD